MEDHMGNNRGFYYADPIIVMNCIRCQCYINYQICQRT